MKQLLILTDPSMPLTEWQDLIDQLITDHGPDTVFSTDAGANNVLLEIEVPELPARPHDGAFDNWLQYTPVPCAIPADKRLVFFDARNRHCSTARQILRARDEGAFPVRYWLEPVP